MRSSSWAPSGCANPGPAPSKAPATKAQRLARRKLMRNSEIRAGSLFDEDIAPGSRLEPRETRWRGQVGCAFVELGEIGPIELGQPGRWRSAAIEQRQDRIGTGVRRLRQGPRQRAI